MKRVALALVVAVVTLLVTPASADQAQGDNAYGLWPGGPWPALSSVVRIERSAPSTFWALAWTWQGNPDGSAGGYVGIQTTTDLAVFSAPFADGAVGDCVQVAEYAATSCRLPLDPVPWTNYYLNVFPVAHDWWEATVNDEVIGELHVVGSGVPVGTASNFAEYFGLGPSCGPASDADFTGPAGIFSVVGSCPAVVHTYPWGVDIALSPTE